MSSEQNYHIELEKYCALQRLSLTIKTENGKLFDLSCLKLKVSLKSTVPNATINCHSFPIKDPERVKMLLLSDHAAIELYVGVY